MTEFHELKLWRLPLATSQGVFMIEITRQGVSRLHFPSKITAVREKSLVNLTSDVRQWKEIAFAALKSSLEGLSPQNLPPFDLTDGTPFQLKVWKALLRIPTGRTISYGELARRVGSPLAARAVGSACGANPVPILIPCHRVLAADGKLGGYSGGISWKRRLLALEGIQKFVEPALVAA